MTQQEIQELAGHRKVSAWVIKLVADAVAIEREACAKLCEEGGKDESGRVHVQAWGCAKAIRARGQV